jgi:hypothetical protein
MPKKSTPSAHVSRVLVAALIGVVAIPTAMTGLFQSIDDDGRNVVPLIDLHNKAINHRSEVRRIRRNYWRAVGVYKELIRRGVEDIMPPDINDTDSVKYYLNPENFAAIEGTDDVLHASPSVEGYRTISAAQVEYRRKSERYRDLLDGYITTGFCPGSLRQYHLTGFFELCNALLEEHIAAVSPSLINRSVYLRGFQSVGFAPLRTLRNRLKVLEESLLYSSAGRYSVRPLRHSGRPRSTSSANRGY